ncbi:MAG: CopG family transcriptional regulator, partial [Chlorobiaceae bacterium]|nr:CopG family transcriptional regulator [Chlorobiaceae bacterium]
SEFLREAARFYIQRQRQWEDLFLIGDRQKEEKQLTVRDVEEEISAVRKERAHS